MLEIIIISSSTRLGRISHRIAMALKHTIETLGHNPKIIDLMELKLPPFEERLSHLENPPQHWNQISDDLVRSDGLIFLTPEYNGSPSSGLKNFIDVFAKKAFEGKPIGVATGSTGRLGGIRAATMLQQMILTVQAFPHPQMLTVAQMDQTLDADGRPQTEYLAQQLNDFAMQYLRWVTRMSGH